MADERAGGAVTEQSHEVPELGSEKGNDMGDWHWHEQLHGAYEGFKADGHDDDEARRLAQWDTRHWWSDSDGEALNRLHPWLPPRLRGQGEAP